LGICRRAQLRLQKVDRNSSETDGYSNLENDFPIRVIFEQCAEGGYSASIKEVPGAISQGETIREAAENVLDALNQLLAAKETE